MFLFIKLCDLLASISSCKRGKNTIEESQRSSRFSRKKFSLFAELGRGQLVLLFCERNRWQIESK